MRLKPIIIATSIPIGVFLAVGTFFDALSNLIDWVNIKASIIGTIIVFTMIILFKMRAFKKVVFPIKNYQNLFGVVIGILLVLWIPLIYSCFYSSTESVTNVELNSDVTDINIRLGYFSIQEGVQYEMYFGNDISDTNTIEISQIPFVFTNQTASNLDSIIIGFRFLRDPQMLTPNDRNHELADKKYIERWISISKGEKYEYSYFKFKDIPPDYNIKYDEHIYTRECWLNIKDEATFEHFRIDSMILVPVDIFTSSRDIKTRNYQLRIGNFKVNSKDDLLEIAIRSFKQKTDEERLNTVALISYHSAKSIGKGFSLDAIDIEKIYDLRYDPDIDKLRFRDGNRNYLIDLNY